jgi:hypothetical protein
LKKGRVAIFIIISERRERPGEVEVAGVVVGGRHRVEVGLAPHDAGQRGRSVVQHGSDEVAQNARQGLKVMSKCVRMDAVPRDIRVFRDKILT